MEPWREELYHHGILGMKWGKRNGPPYPLDAEDHSASERKAGWRKSLNYGGRIQTGGVVRKRRLNPNSLYNKRHVDDVIKKGNTLSTLSYDRDRISAGNMFYATYKALDKHQYNALFNRPIPKTIYDESGNALGTGQFLKWKINNKVTGDIRVASEDSGATCFSDLYKRNKDFRRFVTDPSGMESHFVASKYKFSGYREAKRALDRVRASDPPADKDLRTTYRMFNYVIPSDGGGDTKRADDVAKQRARFFGSLKRNGYGAVLDTNDAIYGGFKATAPVIVFDYSKIALDSIKMTSTKSKEFSALVTAGRKVLGI